jgi:hypothetical protein
VRKSSCCWSYVSSVTFEILAVVVTLQLRSPAGIAFKKYNLWPERCQLFRFGRSFVSRDKVLSSIALEHLVANLLGAVVAWRRYGRCVWFPNKVRNFQCFSRVGGARTWGFCSSQNCFKNERHIRRYLFFCVHLLRDRSTVVILSFWIPFLQLALWRCTNDVSSIMTWSILEALLFKGVNTISWLLHLWLILGCCVSTDVDIRLLLPAVTWIWELGLNRSLKAILRLCVIILYSCEFGASLNRQLYLASLVRNSVWHVYSKPMSLYCGQPAIFACARFEVYNNLAVQRHDVCGTASWDVILLPNSCD